MTISKIKDNPGLVRDMKNQAVLSVDNNALHAYKLNRKKQKEISEAIDDINNMKQDINDLKTLMQRILDKIG